MTDQEIRCAILKYVYNEKKAGKEVVMDVADRVSGDYKIDMEKVLSIFYDLKKEGLIRNAPGATMASATDGVITEKGIREYREKCSESKGG